jgi:hypothetical protein
VNRNERIALIEGVRDASLQVGRGLVVQLLEDLVPRFAPIEEAKARLVEERADPDLLLAVLMAVDKYDPKWQVVVFLEREECSTVTILGYDRSECVWSESWTPTH